MRAEVRGTSITWCTVQKHRIILELCSARSQRGAYVLQDRNYRRAASKDTPALRANSQHRRCPSFQRQDLLKASAGTIEALGRRLADGVIIAIQDHMHRDVVLAFTAKGYHTMTTSLRDCLEIEAAAEEAGVIFGMGHGWSPSSECLCKSQLNGA